MFERILVAIDGGDTTRAALEIACTIADQYKARLAVLYVTEPNRITDEFLRASQVEGTIGEPSYARFAGTFNYLGPIDLSPDVRRAEQAMQLARQIGERVVADAEAFSKEHHVMAVKTYVRSGDVADAIVDVAGETKASLVVMGHDRRSPIGALIHSSVAANVDSRVDCPCLVFSQ